jgi:asparagine synthase (glutamine-hydrolysing)
MCGIAGFLDFSGGEAGQLRNLAQLMERAIAYRGPDAGDTFVDAPAGLALAHRRLSIVELTEAGHQPMTSADGRYVIIYNGEIYNGPEVARDLPGPWRGRSDTEVLLEACAAWGVAAAVPRFIGMFAFGLWDRQERRLSLVRDRLGIKPLYYGRQDNLFLFGSELKALRAHPGWTPQIASNAVAAYLRLGYVPAPLSIYNGIRKLPPGHFLEVDAAGHETLTCFWDLRAHAAAGQANLDNRPEDEIIADIETLLADAVRRRMVADVPLGAFLSGGIDSSTVVALMQTQSSKPVRTFTIGFEDKRFNEAGRAAAIASHLGTDHTELILSAQQAQAVIPLLPEIFDEPFADYSQIPTYLVSRLARSAVTVSLSGDGGDEVFGGYTRYLGIDRIWQVARFIPPAARQGVSAMLRALSPASWDRTLGLLPSHWQPSQFGDKIHKTAGILAERDADAMYGRLVSLWPEAARDADNAAYPWHDLELKKQVPELVARLRKMDMQTYLVDDILTKLDRATMAVGLEGRVPLLDHRVVEMAWRIPRTMLIRHGKGKWPLRQILYRHVPEKLLSQPKMGFSIPLGDWLRGPLRDWAEDLLSVKSLAQCGHVDVAAVRQVWADHLAGRVNRPHQLWVILMLQAWLRAQTT